ncbi:MAG: low molecular weight protein arginine phosphatase [Eubacterium sp.]|nr:low molecular weight protein arginine phosphatase [Eubacterium sp.]
MDIIFVCTGNTCRSPMAETAAKYLIKGHSFSSAGLMAYENMPMSRNAELALEEKKIPYENHLSRNLRPEDIKTADLILTMSSRHKAVLSEAAGDKVFTLKEYTTGAYGDIADPFGGDLEEYVKCLDEITECIYALKERLK